jgi:mono/diheme cytochrome c family protein
MRRILLWAAAGVVALAVVIQAVPYGRDHTNPAVSAEPKWDSPRTRALAVDACFACHSNQTQWPWYSSVAPVSWLTQHDVEDGRRVLNFSEWDRPQEAGEASEAVREGGMPPLQFKLLHPEARLSDTEKQQLIRGLQATLGG